MYIHRCFATAVALFNAISRVNSEPYAQTPTDLQFEDYTVAWIAPLEIEYQAAYYMLDEEHEGTFRSSQGDDYIYTAGEINGHNIVIATFPAGHDYGVGSAAALASQVKKSFPNLWFGLLVGVAAGLPNLGPNTPTPRDIRLGDVLVGLGEGGNAGLISYGLGKETQDGFHLLHPGMEAKVETIVRAVIGRIRGEYPIKGNVFLKYYMSMKDKQHNTGNFCDLGQEKDQLFQDVTENGNLLTRLVQRPRRTAEKRTRVWYGSIGSGDRLMKNAVARDKLRDEFNLIGLEMEAAGIINTIPVGVIRGVCDYGDAQKHKAWQPYAAAMAAAYASDILHRISPRQNRRKARLEEKAIADSALKYQLGLSIDGAPMIDDDAFVGREKEMEQLAEWLSPTPLKQNIVALSGLGGVGKTHLSIHFAKSSQNKYSSVIWLNARDENTVKVGLVALASRILGKEKPNVAINQPNEDQAIRYVRTWLSEPENDKWLVIYDNYDDPQLPGIQTSTGFDIRKFFPFRAQGSILITTRSSRITFGKQLWLQKFKDLQQSLAILANRSGRETETDVDAHKLAERLDGLPLALATAGTYISHTADSFGDYLHMYEETWDELANNSYELQEYEDRTLYSTWSLSLKQVAAQVPEAVEMLRLMAYFSNLDLWYDLFQKGAEGGPAWLLKVVKSKASFNKVMGKLREYSLVEVVEAGSGQYSLHTCVHDWTLEYLNREINADLYRLATRCIAWNVRLDSEGDFWAVNRRLLQHLRRLEFGRLKRSIYWSSLEAEVLYMIASLNYEEGRLAEAEDLFKRALERYQKAWGPEHISTFASVGNLGLLYARQGKHAKAEAMYWRALKGYEKALAPEHNTLNIVENLALLYTDQGKPAEAEAMYMRALEGKERAWGPEHKSTLDTVSYLGNFYANQGKLVEAEAMYRRALEGYQKAWDPQYMVLFGPVDSLGLLYANQGKLAEAKAVFEKYLAVLRARFDRIDRINDMPAFVLYGSLLGMVQDMYRRALEGKEKNLGPKHISTLGTVCYRRTMNVHHNKLVEADDMYKRPLEGVEKAWGSEHTSTIRTFYSLGSLYIKESWQRLKLCIGRCILAKWKALN